MNHYYINSFSMVSAQGIDTATNFENIFNPIASTSKLSDYRLMSSGQTVKTAAIPEILKKLPSEFSKYQCHNHSIAWQAYSQLKNDIDKLKTEFLPERIGVVIGSSTSGTDASESAFMEWKKNGKTPTSFNYESQHELGSVAACISAFAGIRGPAYAVSTACSSSAKAFASARGLIEAGFCDAVITGGIDTLCHLTVEGFHSLGLLSQGISNPMSKNRDGLNIGEGGALFIISKNKSKIKLKGIGESSDGYHISTPCPDGSGFMLSMQRALDDSGLQPKDITYINLHGTGTITNDAAEARAVSNIFGNQTPCSSTKPLTGHCLGAAGAIETAVCCLMLTSKSQGKIPLPPHIWDGVRDEAIPSLNLVNAKSFIDLDKNIYCLSNSFGFGGNNCSIILGVEEYD